MLHSRASRPSKLAIGAAAYLLLNAEVQTAHAQLAFNPDNFTHAQPIDNPYLPYLVGTTFVYDNFSNTGALFQVDTTTVTNDTKRIDGVVCIVVSDIVRDANTGQPLEKTDDYFAQDKMGNVWYFGEHSTGGSWLAGVDGAQPGIVMEAHPRLGDSYYQENAPGIARDHAQVLSLAGEASVPYGEFDHLLVTLETSILEPGAAETKFYAAGIGQDYGVDLVTGEMDKLASVAVAPEPSTWALILLGFAGLGVAGYWRKIRRNVGRLAHSFPPFNSKWLETARSGDR